MPVGDYVVSTVTEEGCVTVHDTVSVGVVGGDLELGFVRGQYVVEPGAAVRVDLRANFPPARVIWDGVLDPDCADCTSREYRPEASTEVTVQAYDAYDCAVTASAPLIVVEDRLVYLPSAISPNGDGNNDVLRVFPARGVTVEELRVFDRWGGVVYVGRDGLLGWDGTKAGRPVAAGVFLYEVAGRRRDGRVFRVRREVVVVR